MLWIYYLCFILATGCRIHCISSLYVVTTIRCHHRALRTLSSKIISDMAFRARAPLVSINCSTSSIVPAEHRG